MEYAYIYMYITVPRWFICNCITQNILLKYTISWTLFYVSWLLVYIYNTHLSCTLDSLAASTTGCRVAGLFCNIVAK